MNTKPLDAGSLSFTAFRSITAFSKNSFLEKTSLNFPLKILDEYSIVDKSSASFTDKESFLESDFEGMKVSEKLLEQTGIIGEKIEIGSFEHISASFVGSYIHAGNKIASIVGFSENFDNAGDVGKDLSMQIAAMNPVAIDENGVSQEIIAKEIEIAKDQLRQEGKPEEMLDNIAKGKLKKFFKENTLINQQFIKDSKISISQYIKGFSESVEVTDFSRVGI